MGMNEPAFSRGSHERHVELHRELQESEMCLFRFTIDFLLSRMIESTIMTLRIT